MRWIPRAEVILPLTIVIAAVMLGVSEFMTTFQFTPPGGEPLREQLASDRHSYALLLLAIFTVASTLFAIASGIRLGAFAAAAFGGAALLIFLIIDLPDVGKLGDLDDPVFGLADVRADPQTGFWLEAVGAVVLALSAGALATLTSEQLRAPLTWLTTDQRKEKRSKRKAARKAKREPFDFEAEAALKESSSSKSPGRLSRLRRSGR
jgi:hypothetical protein